MSPKLPFFFIRFEVFRSFVRFFFFPPLRREDWPLGNDIDGLDQFYHVAMGVYWHFILFQVILCTTFSCFFIFFLAIADFFWFGMYGSLTPLAQYKRAPRLVAASERVAPSRGGMQKELLCWVHPPSCRSPLISLFFVGCSPRSNSTAQHFLTIGTTVLHSSLISVSLMCYTRAL